MDSLESAMVKIHREPILKTIKQRNKNLISNIIVFLLNNFIWTSNGKVETKLYLLPIGPNKVFSKKTTIFFRDSCFVVWLFLKSAPRRSFVSLLSVRDVSIYTYAVYKKVCLKCFTILYNIQKVFFSTTTTWGIHRSIIVEEYIQDTTLSLISWN